jgi:PAS domain S-box-containing protein
MHGRGEAETRKLDFLTTGGETAARIRAQDWSATPLGPIEGWPSCLRTALGLVFGSPFPMVLAWGPELTTLHNDAYRPLLGDKPDALGRPFLEVWPEAREIIAPLLDRAFAGEASRFEDAPFTLLRQGQPAEAFFAFSYSPVRDETGAVMGVLNLAVETTARVLAERRQAFRLALEDRLRDLADPDEIIAVASEALGRHLTAGQVAYAELEPNGECVTIAREWNDGTIPSIAGRHRLDDFGPTFVADLRRGRTVAIGDVRLDPRTCAPDALANFASLSLAGFINAPVIKQGRLVAILAVHHATARSWSTDEVALAEDVAERAWAAAERARAEAELRANEQELLLLTDALPVLVAYMDAQVRYRFVNKLYEEWFPRPRSDLVGKRVRDIVGEEAYANVQHWMDAALAGQRVTFEQFMPYKEGQARHVRVEYVPRIAANGQVQGFYSLVEDVTDQKATEAALRESEARFRHMADSAPALIWMSDEEGRVTFANRHYEHMFGRPAAEMHGDGWAQIVLPEDLKRHTKAFFDAFQARTGFHCETRVIDKVGQVRWLRCEGVPRFDDAQRFLGYTGCNVDITESKVAEERRDLLINELNHRVKNTLATVQSIASQTLRNAPTTQEAKRALEERLFALSRAHDVLTRENWEGADLYEIVAQAVEPYSSRGESRLHLSGPRIRLSPRMALALAMALQELATNAVKYGALSNATGGIGITWSIDATQDPARLHLRWTETGGPPVHAPTRRGFGSRLIERSLADDLAGEVRIEFASAGVTCTADAPITHS